MLRLIPRNEKSLAAFTEMAGLLCEAASKLRELLQHYDRIPDRVREIKDLEHRGDKITHGVLEWLAKTFITPLDREDMHRMASDLDDVLDMIDNVAHHTMDYGIGQGLYGAEELATVLEKQTQAIQSAMQHLGAHAAVLPHCVEIKRLENEGDSICRQAISRLFREQKDAILVIKWKEILENLERATDECEDVANDLENVYLKYA